MRDRIADEPALPVSRACRLVGEQLGINGDTLRNWVRSERVDDGEVAGRTSSDAARMAELEKENRELRRANTILRQASAERPGPVGTARPRHASDGAAATRKGSGWARLSGRRLHPCGHRAVTSHSFVLRLV